MKILYITSDFPFEPLSGCHWFTFNLINYMAQKHDCHLISLGRPGHEARVSEWERSCAHLRVLGVFPVRHNQLVRWAKAANYAANLRLPKLVQWMTPGFTEAVGCALRDTAYDIVHFTDTTMVFYRNLVRQTPVVISGPDPASLHLQGHLRFEPSLSRRLRIATTARAYRDIERTHLRTFSAVHVVSESEAEYLRCAAGLNNVSAISLAVGSSFLDAPPAPPRADGEVTLFTSGSFAIPYIRIPLLRFLAGNWERIRNRHPRARWVVIGTEAPSSVKRQLAPLHGVEFHSWIQDYAGALHRSDIAVFLDGSGTGMKTRVLQAMAAGKAVVGTPFAFTGFDITNRVHAFVAEGEAGVLEAVSALLESPRLRQDVGEAARSFVRARYTLERTGSDWDALYERVSR